MSPISRARSIPQPTSREISVPTFPVHVFPDDVRDFVTTAAASLAAPVDFVALPALAMASVAIGTSRALAINDGYREFACLFLAFVGQPGSRKSPALAHGTRPAREFDAAAARAAASAGDGEGEQFRPHVVTDVTMEAVAEALYHNPRGLLFVQDELSGFLGTMDRYRGGRGNDLQQWMSIYSTQFISVIRKKQSPLTVERPFVTIVGGIQPDTLQDLSTGRMDGFLDRFLISYPDPVPHHRSEVALSQDQIDTYGARMRALYNLNFRNGTEPECLALSDVARQAYEAWVDGHHAEMNGDMPEHLVGAWSKMEGLCLRIALDLELLARPNSTHVKAASLSGAVEVIEYFKAHLKRVHHHLGSTRAGPRGNQVIAYMRSKNGSSIAMRDLQRSGTAGFRTRADVDAVVDQLVREGLAERYAQGKEERVRLLDDAPDT